MYFDYTALYKDLGGLKLIKTHRARLKTTKMTHYIGCVIFVLENTLFSVSLLLKEKILARRVYAQPKVLGGVFLIFALPR